MKFNIPLISLAATIVLAVAAIVMASFPDGPAADAGTASSWLATAFPVGQASFAQSSSASH